MTWQELHIRSRQFTPVLHLEHVFPHIYRRRVERAFLLLFVLGSAYSVVIDPSDAQVGGLVFVVLALWMILVAVDSFFYSFYYRNLDRRKGITYELASVLYATGRDDVTGGFFQADLGRAVAARLGLARSDIDEFLQGRSNFRSVYTTVFDSRIDTLYEYVGELYDNDPELESFFLSHSLSRDECVGAALWVERRQRRWKQKERWWSRERLSRLRQIGVGLSYGRTYTLDHFSHQVDATRSHVSVSDYYEAHITSLATILSRHREANALLVGKAGIGKRDIIALLQQEIERGRVHGLENYQMKVLDTELVFSGVETAADFESRFITICEEGERSGNTIMVIEDVSTFLARVKDMGSDPVTLLDSFLASSQMHFIFTSTEREYHQSIEPCARFMQRVERIFIREGGLESVVRLLEDEVAVVESEEDIFFTYPALEELATAAAEYFTGSSVSDKATDLLYEIVPRVHNKDRQVVFRSDVSDLLEARTGVPSGEVEEEERSKLLQLETLLHKRVVGQDAAVGAVSDALRRARSGVVPLSWANRSREDRNHKSVGRDVFRFEQQGHPS